MPRSNGTYSFPTNSWNPQINGSNATAADFAALLADLANAITQTVSKDGSVAFTSNAQMGGNRITNLADGVSDGDAVNWGQLNERAPLASPSLSGVITLLANDANFGGRLLLEKNSLSTLIEDVFIDIYDNKLRIYSSIYPYKGAYLPISELLDGVGSRLITNNAPTITGPVLIVGSLSTSTNFYCYGATSIVGQLKVGSASHPNAKVIVSSDSYGASYPTQCFAYANATFLDLYMDSAGTPTLNADAASNWSPPYCISVQYRGMDTFKVANNGDLRMNSGFGSVATAFGVRAWVNFDGTAGTITPRAGGNISSITDNGTGNYTANFTNAMPDPYYAVSGTAKGSTAVATLGIFNDSTDIKTTTSYQFRVRWTDTKTSADSTEITLMVVR